MRRPWLRGLAMLAAAGLARPGLAQQPGAEPIEPGLALLAAQMAYETEPFAERLRIYVGPRPWEGRSETAVVRCDPASGRVRLELGTLEISFADGQMVAVRRDNPRDVLVRRYEPPLTMAKLAELLPPVPAPGLSIALDEGLDDLAPYLAVEAWRSAQMDPAAGAVMNGELSAGGAEGGGGEITVRLQRSGRVEHVVAQLAPERWISIQVTAAGPGDPAAWSIDPAGRRRVDSLAALAPPRVLRAGDRAPDLRFVDDTGEPWRVSEALQAGPVAIALVRAGTDGAMEAARAAVEALEEQPELNGVVAVVYTMEAWSLNAMRDDSAALLAPEEGDVRSAGEAEGSATAGAEQRRPIRALWSVSPRQIVDIAPGEPVVIVVIGADGSVAGVVPAAGRAAGELAAELEAIGAAR